MHLGQRGARYTATGVLHPCVAAAWQVERLLWRKNGSLLQQKFIPPLRAQINWEWSVTLGVELLFARMYEGYVGCSGVAEGVNGSKYRLNHINGVTVYL